MTALYTRTMLPDSKLVASIERTAREDRQTLDALAKLERLCATIRQQSAPRDFLGRPVGIEFVNLAYDLTGCDALYDLRRDVEVEQGITDDPDASLYNAADYGHDSYVADGLARGLVA